MATMIDVDIMIGSEIGGKSLAKARYLNRNSIRFSFTIANSITPPPQLDVGIHHYLTFSLGHLLHGKPVGKEGVFVASVSPEFRWEREVPSVSN